jgi:SAM-dependent methyltransferase
MEKYGSDKGAVKPTRHNYSILYNSLFKSRFQEPVRIFELGLGTNNVSMASNMGADGKPGASLYAWRELFPKAQIFGADIDRQILFESERIKTFYCDQTSETSIKELWGSNDLQDGFDIIIDDGLHTFEANQCFFENSSKKIRPGGYYIIEDMRIPDKEKFKVGIKLWKKLYKLPLRKYLIQIKVASILLQNFLHHFLQKKSLSVWTLQDVVSIIYL